MLQKIVSLTDQNQVSIPMWMVKSWGEEKPTKLVVTKIGDEVRMRPVKNFWSLAGSMKSKTTLSDEQLQKAKESFESEWPDKI